MKLRGKEGKTDTEQAEFMYAGPCEDCEGGMEGCEQEHIRKTRENNSQRENWKEVKHFIHCKNLCFLA